MRVSPEKYVVQCIWRPNTYNPKTKNVLFKIAMTQSEFNDGIDFTKLSGGRPLFAAVQLGNDKPIKLGECWVHAWTGAGLDQNTTYTFAAPLETWQLQNADQLKFSEKLLTLIIVDLAEHPLPYDSSDFQENVHGVDLEEELIS